MNDGRVELSDKRRVSLPFLVIDAFDRLSGRTRDAVQIENPDLSRRKRGNVLPAPHEPIGRQFRTGLDTHDRKDHHPIPGAPDHCDPSREVDAA